MCESALTVLKASEGTESRNISRHCLRIFLGTGEYLNTSYICSLAEAKIWASFQMGKFETQINDLSGLGHLLGADVFMYLHTYVQPNHTPLALIELLFVCSGVSNVAEKGSTL